MLHCQWWFRIVGEGKGWRFGLLKGKRLWGAIGEPCQWRKKVIKSDEEGSGVDTGASSLLSIFFFVADKVAIHSLVGGGLSFDKDWIIFHASTGSMFDSARWLWRLSYACNATWAKHYKTVFTREKITKKGYSNYSECARFYLKQWTLAQSFWVDMNVCIYFKFITYFLLSRVSPFIILLQLKYMYGSISAGRQDKELLWEKYVVVLRVQYEKYT